MKLAIRLAIFPLAIYGVICLPIPFYLQVAIAAGLAVGYAWAVK